MRTTRRAFLGSAAALAATPGLFSENAGAIDRAVAVSEPFPDASGERIATSFATFFRPYTARPAANPRAMTWVQIDLGSSQAIELVRLYPSNGLFSLGNGFPVRFLLECSNDITFAQKRLIADRTKAEFPNPGNRVLQYPSRRTQGRYVRLTVTQLRPRMLPSFTAAMPAPIQAQMSRGEGAEYCFSLSKIEVLSGGRDIAVHCLVSADEVQGNPTEVLQLTRPPRPQGESLVTDHAENVTPMQSWLPVAYRAQAPLAAVHLKDGLFLAAVQHNIHYLLESFTIDDLLRQFRERAGKSLPATARTPEPFWEEDLGGSSAGRFLMGAGNVLRWLEHPELRTRMNAVVAGIAECRQANGYIMGYPEETFFDSERGAYTRSWTTHGLLAAGYAGNVQAFELLRGYYDWYNARPYLARALRECAQGGQGMVANTRMYFSPVGTAADLHVLQRYFQENYWLEDLAARRVEAIWQYPYDRPHCYLLTNLEAYLDLYRATGDRRYLQAVLGAWDLYRNNWQNVGGSISIIELTLCPPKSNSLYEKLGETCGSAFWVLLNHRLHLLDPESEKYTAEIEKTIYNVLLANQGGAQGIRYHTSLVGRKEAPTHINTCCEGQGTRLLGSLPEYIYSLCADGIYVNLYEPSTIDWTQAGESLQLRMETAFPQKPDVRLGVQCAAAVTAKIRIRVPSWASSSMDVHINGKRFASGTPGSYVTLSRRWLDGDSIAFVLPIDFRLTRYAGVDRIEGQDRFALEYGPLLMAAVGAADTELVLIGAKDPRDLVAQLQPVPEKPLHFTMYTFSLGAPNGPTEFMPYFAIDTESFSCVPPIKTTPLPI